MATTFQVFSLGNTIDIDPTEGNYQAELASQLVNTSYGDIGDPLFESIQTLTPVIKTTTSRRGGTQETADYATGGNITSYDTNNALYQETFQIDGGPPQTMDGLAVYNATLTYVDGSTASISAVLFQDTDGNLYMAPEFSQNLDQAALEALPIRSLTLGDVLADTATLLGDRVDGTYATCFTSGTTILTPRGERLIDELRVGDHVTTMDNGPQPIRWIGRRTIGAQELQAHPNLRPILFRSGLMGLKNDLLVSPQHGMLIGADTLIRAKHLAQTPNSGIRIAHGKRGVSYIHLMFDAHQVVFAEGIPSESFYPGEMAQATMSFAAHSELQQLFPDIFAANDLRDPAKTNYGETARRFAPRKSVLQHFQRAYPKPKAAIAHLSG